MKKSSLSITVILILLFACTDSGLNNIKKKSHFNNSQVNKNFKVIIIQPLGEDLPAAFINIVYQEMKKYLPQINVKKIVPLPMFAFNRERGRYRADSLIKWMSKLAKPNEVIIGVTNIDISATKNQHRDWGVMGLGYRPGNAAVASNFRLKNKSEFWKIAIHELGHTAGLSHCPVKSCFMRDAKGKDNTDEENSFCPTCKSVLIKSGWKL